MRREVDEMVEKLAAPRGGAFHRREVYDAGGDYQLLWRRVTTGRWIDRGCDTLALATHPPSLVQDRWLGILAGGPGAHLSFESAAEVHRVDGVRRGLAVVTVDHPRHLVVPGVRFHQLTDVTEGHLMRIDGWPITTPARTVIDLAAAISTVRLGIAVEDVVVRRLATFGQLDAVLRAVRRRGKPGIRKLVRVLDARNGEPLPASELERLLFLAATRARVTVVRQHPLPSREHVVGVVDGAILDSKIILEADGRTWHTRLQAMANDRRRDREAARLGWLTLRFVHEDLTRDLAGAADDILTTHLQRTRG